MPPSYHAYISPARCLTRDNWSAIGITGSPGGNGHLGTAIPAGDTDGPEDRAEVVWVLVVRGQRRDGAYRLRGGRFEELGDVVEWTRREFVGNAIRAAEMVWRAGRDGATEGAY